MQGEIAQLKYDLQTEQAVNKALRQKTQGALRTAVKPQLPPAFHGKMDGTSVSKFVHQMNTYFDLVDLLDDNKRG